MPDFCCSCFLDEQVTSRSQEHLAKQRQQREENFILQAQQAFENLQTTGQEVVTISAICQAINLAEQTLYRYPRLKSFVQQIATAEIQPGKGHPEE